MEEDQHNKERLKLIDANAEHTAYNQLTTMPLEKNGFHFEESTFLNSLHVQYNIPLKHPPSKCICAAVFDIERALSCKKGGLITLR